MPHLVHAGILDDVSGGRSLRPHWSARIQRSYFRSEEGLELIDPALDRGLGTTLHKMKCQLAQPLACLGPIFRYA